MLELNPVHTKLAESSPLNEAETTLGYKNEDKKVICEV